MTTTPETASWRPAPGQIALIEPVGSDDCLTGVVVPGARLSIDLGASPRPALAVTEVTASFFAPDALYRLSAHATVEDDGLLTLDVSRMERVQRRATPRVLMTLPVRLRAAAGVLVGETVDVSAGGCRVTIDRPWAEDADPEVLIDLPDGKPLVTTARVVTSDLTGGGWEYRLSFPAIGTGDRDRLSRLVALGV